MVKKKKEEHNPFLLEWGKEIGSTRKKRLLDSGIKYIQDICMSSPQGLSRITTLPEKDCEKIWLKTKEKLEKLKAVRPSQMSANDEIEYDEKNPKLQTECIAMDHLFGGGIPMETLTEIYGSFGSGKTQMLHVLAVEAVNRGYNIIVVDCENTYKLSRYLQVAEAKGYIDSIEDRTKFLSGIKKYSCTNSFETRTVLENMTEYMLENNVKLVLVDGVIGQIRKEWMGRGELSERQQYLKPFMERLGAMPIFLRCWVVFTNQIQHDPGKFFGDPTKPIGGNVVAHEATYRLYLQNPGKLSWMATMVDSPEHAKQDVKFKLGAKGLEDTDEELKRFLKDIPEQLHPDLLKKVKDKLGKTADELLEDMSGIKDTSLLDDGKDD